MKSTPNPEATGGSGAISKVGPDKPPRAPVEVREGEGADLESALAVVPKQAKEHLLTIVWILVVIILVLLAIALVRRVL